MWKIEGRMPGNVTVSLSSKTCPASTATEELMLKAYLPGLEVETLRESDPLIEINHQECVGSARPSLERDQFHFTLTDFWNGKISPDLYHLAYSVSRSALLERDYYSVHSACGGPSPDNQILIVGHSGSGKTTVALTMAVRHGWQVSSGNKTLVSFDPKSQITACAGTTTMTIRAQDSRTFKELLGSEAHDYGARVAFPLGNQYLSRLQGQSIKAIVLVAVREGLAEMRRLPALEALHTLYPFFMDSVNADTVVANGQGIYRAPAMPASASRLALALSKSLARIPVVAIVGNLGHVEQSLVRI